MAQISQEYVDAVLSRADIIDVISSRVSIKKQGKNYAGCCPFHDEKTPSFTANHEKQFFYCFGCGAGGDVIAFVMRYDSLEFPAAVRALGQKLGLGDPAAPTNKRYIKGESKLRKALNEELYLLRFFKACIDSGQEMTEKSDIERQKLALARVKKINEVLNGAF